MKPPTRMELAVFVAVCCYVAAIIIGLFWVDPPLALALYLLGMGFIAGFIVGLYYRK